MKKIIFFLLLITSVFTEEKYKISSDSVLFDNNKLIFTNDFTLNHDFGKITSKKAEIEGFEKSNIKLALFDNVTLQTKENATLQSDSAFFDATTSKITFVSDNKVRYNALKKNKDIFISSKTVECLLNIANFQNRPNINNVYSISFLDDLLIFVDNKYKIFANKGIYQNDNDSTYLFLYPEKNKKCQFLFDSSQIYFHTAKYDVNSSTIYAEKANGNISNIVKKQNSLKFLSDEITINNFENSLSLKGNVFLEEKDSFEMTGEEIELIKRVKDSSIHKIITRGNTNIIFFDKNNDIQSELSCSGNIELDNEKKIVNAFTSKKKNNDDIIFQDNIVTITSKKATLSYTTDNTIKTIDLEDSVKFIYKKDANTLGYGIADKILYSPESKIIKLSCLEDKKVLFWQDDESIHLSANAIVIDQKEKESIKGIGDVRFTFNVDEENILNEIFSEYLWAND